MASESDFLKPKYITGGCLCGALRYRVNFPEGHDFLNSSGTCQCTQCRRNTSSLMFVSHRIDPASTSFRFTTPAPESHLREYRCTPGNVRAFCGDCGSWLYWKRADQDRLSVAVGTIDPLYLWGEGAEEVNQQLGEEAVPKGGFARALINGGQGHEWCRNEIPGITDAESMSLMRGRRWETDSD